MIPRPMRETINHLASIADGLAVLTGVAAIYFLISNYTPIAGLFGAASAEGLFLLLALAASCIAAALHRFWRRLS